MQAGNRQKLYAGFWRRFAAAILDLIILLIPMFVLSIVVALVTGPKSQASAMADLSTLFVLWLYFAIMESSRKQATLGKLAFGMRVVDLHGNRISFLRASARFLAKIFSTLSLALGYVMAAFTRRKQALHDIVTSCLVVNREIAPSDLREAGLAQPMSAGGIVALATAAVCLPLAGVVAAYAIPYYQDYRLRAQLDDAVRSGQSATAGVTAYMLKHRTPPHSLEEAHAKPSSPHLREAVITRDGTIVLTLAIHRLDGKRIAFVPSRQSNQIVWTCTSDDIAARYLPRQCKR